MPVLLLQPSDGKIDYASGWREVLGDAIEMVGGKPHALFGMEQAVADIVAANLQPQRGFGLVAEQGMTPFALRRAAEDVTRILLLELVAANGIVEEIGEVGKEIEIVIKPVERDAGDGIAVALVPLAGKRIASGLAAVAGIEFAPA